MLTEKKHVHKIRVYHIQVANAREEGLPEDAMENIQICWQLIGLLLSHWVNLQGTVWLERLLVSGSCIAVRAKANWVLKTVIFNAK